MRIALLIVCTLFTVVNAGIGCVDREEGLYAKGCSSAFTRCHNKRDYELNCPASLVFNPDTAKCDYSSNVALCLNRAISKNMVVKAVDPFNCTSREDGLYSNGKCTPTYFHCFRGNMAEMPCPPNLFYRAKTKSCDHENLVEECGVLLALQGRRTSQISGSIPVNQYSAPSTFDCSRKTNGLYSSGSCSQYYYQCSNGLVYTKNCASELFFNQQNGQCDYKDSVPECTTSSNIPVAMESAATTIPPFSCAQKQDGVYSGSQGGCVPYFWMCVNMVSHLYKCPQGLFFSRETGQCDFIGEVFECNGGISKMARQPPTPAVISFSCDGKIDGFYEIGTCVDTFVQCSGAVMLQQKCPSGLVFSAALETCDYTDRCRQAATTTTTTQPPPVFDCSQKTDGFFEIGHCEQSYVLCSNRVAYSQRCPSGLVFSILSGACDYHQNCISEATAAADPSRFSAGGRGSGRQPGPSGQRQQPPAARPNTRWGPMPQYTERPSWPTGMPNNWFTETPTPPTDSPSDTITPSCLDLEDGPHAFQRCSSTYYNCWAQKTYMNKCPSNLVFNPYNGQCDFARNVPECSESSGPVMPQDAPNPVRKSPQNDSFCESKSDGLFSAGCETFFYVCRSRHAYRFDCPLGLYYGNTKDQCDLLENVPSCNGGLLIGAQRSLPEFSCVGRQDGYYRTGCTSHYYACAAGIRNQFECPSNLVYDEMRQACNYAELVHGCEAENSTGNGTKLQPMLAETAAKANKGSEGFCLPLTDGVYADGCSAHYFICADAKTFTYTCPQGQVFNENTAACDSPANVRQCRMLRSQTAAK